MKKKLGLGLLLSWAGATCGFSYALEQPPPQWKGPYGGLILSYEWSRITDKAGVAPAGAKPRGFGYGLNLGAGFTPTRLLYLGGDFAFVISNASWSGNAVAGAPKVSAKARQKYVIQPTAQIGIPVNAYLPYLEIGYGWSKYTGAVYTPSLPTVDIKGHTSGLVWGLGLKHQAQGVFFSFGYQTQTGGYIIQNGVKMKVRAHGLRLGICYMGNF